MKECKCGKKTETKKLFNMLLALLTKNYQTKYIFFLFVLLFLSTKTSYSQKINTSDDSLIISKLDTWFYYDSIVTDYEDWFRNPEIDSKWKNGCRRAPCKYI